MKPVIKWTLIVIAGLAALCLLSPLALAKNLTESDLKDEGFTDFEVKREGLLTFSFEGHDKRGQLCTGTIHRGYTSSSRDSVCHTVRTNQMILHDWTKELMEKVKLPFGEITCAPIPKDAPSATCVVTPKESGSSLTVRFAHSADDEWTITGPTTMWGREDIADDIRKKLVKRGNAIESIDCGGLGLIGPMEGDTLECTIHVEKDDSPHVAKVTFDASNYKWSSDL